MAKFVIKESEIRNYVRRLIREAIEAEAPVDPEDKAERDKMLAGQQYDRSKFPNGGQSMKMEREYRAKMGLPPLRKPSGGVVPRIIGADGRDLTPENSPEACASRLEQGKRRNIQKTRDNQKTRKAVEQGKTIMSQEDWMKLSSEEQKEISNRNHAIDQQLAADKRAKQDQRRTEKAAAAHLPSPMDGPEFAAEWDSMRPSFDITKTPQTRKDFAERIAYYKEQMNNPRKVQMICDIKNANNDGRYGMWTPERVIADYENAIADYKRILSRLPKDDNAVYTPSQKDIDADIENAMKDLDKVSDYEGDEDAEFTTNELDAEGNPVKVKNFNDYVPQSNDDEDDDENFEEDDDDEVNGYSNPYRKSPKERKKKEDRFDDFKDFYTDDDWD